MKTAIDLTLIWKNRRWIFWGAAVLVTVWTLFFLYHNWYRVIVNPPPLDPTLTQRRQTAVATDIFDQIESLDLRWHSRPELAQPVNVFDATRVTE